MSSVLDLDLDFFRFVSSVLEDLMAPSYVTSVNFPFAGAAWFYAVWSGMVPWSGKVWYGMVWEPPSLGE